MILSAGKEEIFSFARPIGIGLIESAINLTHICLLDRPNSLIFIGSAGSYNPKKHKIFDIITSSSASQIETSFLQKKSYTPIDNFVTANVSRETIINSSNYITTDKVFALAFDSLGFEIDTMMADLSMPNMPASVPVELHSDSDQEPIGLDNTIGGNTDKFFQVDLNQQEENIAQLNACV